MIPAHRLSEILALIDKPSTGAHTLREDLGRLRQAAGELFDELRDANMRYVMVAPVEELRRNRLGDPIEAGTIEATRKAVQEQIATMYRGRSR